jgi:hypothetical protein
VRDEQAIRRGYLRRGQHRNQTMCRRSKVHYSMFVRGRGSIRDQQKFETDRSKLAQHGASVDKQGDAIARGHARAGSTKKKRAGRPKACLLLSSSPLLRRTIASAQSAWSALRAMAMCSSLPRLRQCGLQNRDGRSISGSPASRWQTSGAARPFAHSSIGPAASPNDSSAKSSDSEPSPPIQEATWHLYCLTAPCPGSHLAAPCWVGIQNPPPISGTRGVLVC